MIESTRLFNVDETPQFFYYGVDGTSANTFYCGRGDTCQGPRTQNRTCATITPIIDLAGRVIMTQVIFRSPVVQTSMAPAVAVDNIPNFMVSTTEFGYQTGESMLEFYKNFDEVLTKENVTIPVVVMTDGHSSRFDLDLLKFCQEKQIIQFWSPPDTTSLLQPLDQINALIHRFYRLEEENR